MALSLDLARRVYKNRGKKGTQSRLYRGRVTGKFRRVEASPLTRRDTANNPYLEQPGEQQGKIKTNFIVCTVGLTGGGSISTTR